jgi:hypothetical protein
MLELMTPQSEIDVLLEKLPISESVKASILKVLVLSMGKILKSSGVLTLNIVQPKLKPNEMHKRENLLMKSVEDMVEGVTSLEVEKDMQDVFTPLLTD